MPTNFDFADLFGIKKQIEPQFTKHGVAHYAGGATKAPPKGFQFPLGERAKSTCVANVEYDPETQDLTIEFNERGTYVYHVVPPDVYIDFETSGSRGHYFNENIRGGNYEFERVG